MNLYSKCWLNNNNIDFSVAYNFFHYFDFKI